MTVQIKQLVMNKKLINLCVPHYYRFRICFSQEPNIIRVWKKYSFLSIVWQCDSRSAYFTQISAHLSFVRKEWLWKKCDQRYLILFYCKGWIRIKIHCKKTLTSDFGFSNCGYVYHIGQDKCLLLNPRWLSGRAFVLHAGDRGSIPGRDRKNKTRQLELHCQVIGNRCECHGF